MLSANAIRGIKGKYPLAMLTCYDYPGALTLSQTAIDLILVGDSLGEVVYGDSNTTHVDVALMARHVQAVKRGAPNKHVMADMVFDTYQRPADAVKHAISLKKAGADSVKMEIPSPEVIKAVISAGIPVFGHVGLTPQTIHDYKKQGKDERSARRIKEQAAEQVNAGCFGVVLEAIPDQLAKDITGMIDSPTIGIASGAHCDGQVLVWHDLLGMYERERSYVKKQVNLHEITRLAIRKYLTDLKS